MGGDRARALIERVRCFSKPAERTQGFGYCPDVAGTTNDVASVRGRIGKRQPQNEQNTYPVFAMIISVPGRCNCIQVWGEGICLVMMHSNLLLIAFLILLPRPDCCLGAGHAMLLRHGLVCVQAQRGP